MRKGLQTLDFSFEAQSLTHFGGLFLIQRFCNRLCLRRRLERILKDRPNWSEYHPVDLVLVVLYVLIAGLSRVNKTQILHYNGLFLSLVGLGEALRATGRVDEARRAYLAATEIDAGNAYAWNGLGATLAQGGRAAEAETAFRRALALEPQRPDIRTNLGWALLDQHKASDAEAVFREALRARPDHPGTRDGLARALAEMGRVKEARALFEETLRLAPDDRDAAEGLARLRGR